jgi:ribosomal protein L37E
MNNKKSNYVDCPECGKKVNTGKTTFCQSCGIELFTPVISKKWSMKVVSIIIIVTIVMYTFYLLLAPRLHFWLDTI